MFDVRLRNGISEDGAFWLQFLKSLIARGLKGVQLVISDAHSDLRASDFRRIAWGELAAMPCPLATQCISFGSQVGHADGCSDHPKYLYPTGCDHRA